MYIDIYVIIYICCSNTIGCLASAFLPATMKMASPQRSVASSLCDQRYRDSTVVTTENREDKSAYTFSNMERERERAKKKTSLETDVALINRLAIANVMKFAFMCVGHFEKALARPRAP